MCLLYTSTVTGLPQPIHKKSLVCLGPQIKNCLFALVCTSTITSLPRSTSPGLEDGKVCQQSLVCLILYNNNHLFASLVCFILYINNHLFASFCTSTVTCMPHSVHQQSLIVLYINNHLFASFCTSAITCLPHSVHQQSLIH